MLVFGNLNSVRVFLSKITNLNIHVLFFNEKLPEVLRTLLRREGGLAERKKKHTECYLKEFGIFGYEIGLDKSKNIYTFRHLESQKKSKYH